MAIDYTDVLGAGGNAAISGVGTSTLEAPSKLQQLFANPNFISLLAGMGARLDPTGVGGALGGATQEYIRAKARQDFATAQNARNTPPTQNPLTPEGVPGPTSRTRTENADGTYSTTEKGDAPVADATAAPGATAPTAPRTRTRVSDLPFLLAPQSPVGDMRGMSAEDVSQAMLSYNEGERLRQSNIGQILAAYNAEESAASGQAVGELQDAQRRLLEAQIPGASRAQSAVSALNEASAAARRSTTAQEEALGDLPAQLMRAQVEHAKDIHGTYTDYTLPDGQIAKATVSERAQIEGAKAAADRQSSVHQDLLNHQAIQVKRWATEDEQKRLNSATEAEKEILGVGPDKVANAEKPEIQGTIDQFNAASDKPYIYTWEPFVNPTIGPRHGGATKVVIPPIIRGGKSIQLRANQISRLASEGDPVHGIPPMTPKEYIDRVLTPAIGGRK